MNVIPKCIDCSGKYPHYENLPETYAAINVYLAANPLEGHFVELFHVTYTRLTSFWFSIFSNYYNTIRYDTECYFNVRSRAYMIRLDLPHGTNN